MVAGAWAQASPPESPSVDSSPQYPVKGSSAKRPQGASSVPTQVPLPPVDKESLDALFQQAVKLIERAESSGRSYHSVQIAAAIRTHKIACDASTGSGPGEENALAVSHQGRVRLHPILFQLHIPERFVEASALEQLEKSVTLASILVHEWSHILDPRMPQGFEVSRYQLERSFLRTLIEQEDPGSKRYQTIYRVAHEREEIGYQQGDYGGNLSGPRWFP